MIASTPWPVVRVGDCLAPMSLAGRVKVQARDYKPSGRFPVIDQGQSDIAGWTDDDAAVIREPLPVVVFGDHTRVFKYVDFPFARGADGTQLLRPSSGIDPLYFYYACRALRLPARGYNRHFNLLKSELIGTPNESEQILIGKTLRIVDDALRLAEKTIRAGQVLKRSALRELFARGLRGELQKETEIGSIPANWDLVQLADIARIGNGSTPNRRAERYWNGDIPYLTSGKMYSRDIIAVDEFVTEQALQDYHLPRLTPGTILMAIVGQGKTLGHCALLKIDATVSRHVGYMILDQSRVRPSFCRQYLEVRYDYLRALAAGNGSTRGALTAGILRRLTVPMPSLDEQDEVSSILDSIDEKIDLHKRKMAVIEELFKALLDGLMSGRIRTSDLDLSALQAPVPDTAEEPVVAVA